MKYILASASPRRRELLARTGIEYTVIPSDVEEIITKTEPCEVVMELAALKIANQMNEDMLLRLGYRKMCAYTEYLEANGVIILATNGMIEKKEKNICFRAKIYAREQIGISIPAEEISENEFE